MASKITIKAERRIPLPTTYAYLNLVVLAEDTFEKTLAPDERRKHQNEMLMDAEDSLDQSMARIGVESDKPEVWNARQRGRNTKTRKGGVNNG